MIPQADNWFVPALVFEAEYPNTCRPTKEEPARLWGQSKPASGDHANDVATGECKHVAVQLQYASNEMVGADCHVVRRFAAERDAGETFRGWMDRVGGAPAVSAELRDLDWFPSPEEQPEFYADYDETGPFVATVGDSECAT